MNLNSIVENVVSAVTPQTPLTVKQSIGYTTNGDGSRTPNYNAPFTINGSMQAMSGRDLRQVEGLNLQGTLMAIYLDGAILAAQRVTMKGGDIITDPSGNVWLVSLVSENWPDWTKVIVTLQNGA